MLNMNILKALFLFTFLFLFTHLDAQLLDFTKQLDSIQVIVNPDQLRLPGEDFDIGVVAYFKNGKVKKTWNLESGMMPWFRFNVEVKGGRFMAGRVRVDEKLIPCAGKDVRIEVWPNKAKRLAKKLILPLNYDEKVEIVPVSDLVKAPGFGFNFKVVSTFNNGVKREYLYKNKDDLSKNFILAVNGGELRKDQYYIESNIRLIRNHTVNLTAISKRNPDCSHSFDLLLDYKANYNLTLRGTSGSDGSNGSDGSDGSSGSDGGSGSDGRDGDDGGNGPEISVWVDWYFDDLLNKNLLYVYAKNLSDEHEYRYLVNPDGGSFQVTSKGGSGGNGGKGGDGGDGGKGSDGSTYTKEEKTSDSTSVIVTHQDPGGKGGNGGPGGRGGHGGDGGDGGNIHLYFTDDALDFQKLIHSSSEGGYSGDAGRSGSGGSGGSGGNGNPAGSSGNSGFSGSAGFSGFSGKPGEILIDRTDDFVK